MKIYQEVRLNERERVVAGKSLGPSFDTWLCFGKGAETVTVYFEGADRPLAEKIASLIEGHRAP